VARAAFEDSLAYAQVRKTFGKPICEHQAIALKLADMATRAGMAKLAATEAAMENAQEAMRIHGAYGYSKEFDIERYYRDAPLLCIGEGTNELQRIIIAKQLVKKYPA